MSNLYYIQFKIILKPNNALNQFFVHRPPFVKRAHDVIIQKKLKLFRGTKNCFSKYLRHGLETKFKSIEIIKLNRNQIKIFQARYTS